VATTAWQPAASSTCHCGQSARRAEQITDFFCKNLARYQTGEPLLNLVDKRLGFPPRYGKPA
jgi:hypothetical protein